MINLEFSTREMTVQEVMLADSSILTDHIAFILSRAERIEGGDTEALTRYLWLLPFSEFRALFLRAGYAAVATTKENIERVNASFARVRAEIEGATAPAVEQCIEGAGERTDDDSFFDQHTIIPSE